MNQSQFNKPNPTLRLGSLLRVFDADFATRHQPECAHILAHAVFVHRDLAGFQVGNEAAVRIADHHVQQHLADRATDHVVMAGICVLRRRAATDVAEAYSD